MFLLYSSFVIIHTSVVPLISGLSSNSISQVDLCVPNLMGKYQLVFT